MYFAPARGKVDSDQIRENEYQGPMKRLAVALVAVLFAVPALAQDWPSSSVRIIVPFGAGATPDLVARLIADALHQKLGQTFIVENRPGASGNIGTGTLTIKAPAGFVFDTAGTAPTRVCLPLFMKRADRPFLWL